MGEWLVWAGEAGADVGTPVWATILVAVIALLGSVIAYKASEKNTEAVKLTAIQADSTANRAIEQARDAAERANETARHANMLAASKSNRDLILAAVQLTESDNEAAWRKGFALLDGLSRMKGLSTDDAILIESLTSPLTAETMERLRQQQVQQEQRQGEEVGDDRGDQDH